MPYETRTGTSQHGQCSFCGADKVLSPKSGKVFCSEKCWLKGQPQTTYNAPQAPRTSEPSQSVELSQFITKTEYNAILDKQRSVFAKMQEQINEIIKTQNYLREMLEVNKPTAFVTHSDQIPVIGAENFVDDATKALGL
jgi:uncharacterized Zn finger protein (UPF0148 family)